MKSFFHPITKRARPKDGRACPARQESWVSGLVDFRLKAWSLVAVGFTRVCAHGGRFPSCICPAGAIQRGIKSFWPALSGRGNFLVPVPRPMASATVVQAFGLDFGWATASRRSQSNLGVLGASVEIQTKYKPKTKSGKAMQGKKVAAWRVSFQRFNLLTLQRSCRAVVPSAERRRVNASTFLRLRCQPRWVNPCPSVVDYFSPVPRLELCR